MEDHGGVAAQVLVLGGGFGGLFSAVAVSRWLRGRARVVLVDRNDFFLFTPLLYDVVTGRLRPHHVARPLRRLLSRSVEFVQAGVEEVDLYQHRVRTDRGPLSYDFLVLALGSVPNFYGVPGAEEHALRFKWLPDALRLRQCVLDRVTRGPGEAVRVVVVGAGCTGVELSVGLHDWVRRLGRARLSVLEAMPQLLCPMDPRLMRATVRALRSRDIEVRLGTVVEEVRAEAVVVRSGGARELVPADLVVWTAGVQANPLVRQLPVELGPGGRVLVTSTLQLPSFPEVLSLGDVAACPDQAGVYLPATAQVAVQQAAAAARALVALVEGRTPQAFRYRRKGEVLGLGRMGAVAEAFGVRLVGLPAWLVASLVHLVRLPDWGDRAAVAWEWAKDAVGLGRPASREDEP